MSAIGAKLVQELRQRTGVGMMECKKALVKTDGDLEAAIDHLKQAGSLKAEKRSDNITSEGLVSAILSADSKSGTILEVNCETDFVSRSDDFKNFCTSVAQAALDNKLSSVEELSSAKNSDGKTMDEYRLEVIAKLGENISLRRVVTLEAADGFIGRYIHGAGDTARMAALVSLQKEDADLAKDLSMQIVSMKPLYINREDVPSETVEREINNVKELLKTEAADKSDEVREKMLKGRVDKVINEAVLMKQSFFKESSLTIEKLIKQKGNSLNQFIRFEVGEGLAKKEENFAEEVMSQVNK